MRYGYATLRNGAITLPHLTQPLRYYAERFHGATTQHQNANGRRSTSTHQYAPVRNFTYTGRNHTVPLLGLTCARRWATAPDRHVATPYDTIALDRLGRSVLRFELAHRLCQRLIDRPAAREITSVKFFVRDAVLFCEFNEQYLLTGVRHEAAVSTVNPRPGISWKPGDRRHLDIFLRIS